MAEPTQHIKRVVPPCHVNESPYERIRDEMCQAADCGANGDCDNCIFSAEAVEFKEWYNKHAEAWLRNEPKAENP